MVSTYCKKCKKRKQSPVCSHCAWFEYYDSVNLRYYLNQTSTKNQLNQLANAKNPNMVKRKHKTT